MSEYLVVYEKTGTGYSAFAPDLPGCISTGSSLNDVRHNMEEAIAGHLAVMREFGDPVPVAEAIAEHLAIHA